MDHSKENVILLDPHPRSLELIFSDEDRGRLESLGKVLWHEGSAVTDEHIEDNLANTVAIIGQTAMSHERLERAPKLRVIANVEGNFLPNIDYAECHRRGIPVLTCAPAFAPAVAEMALGLALAAARGIVQGDAAMRAGTELYSRFSNRESFLLRSQTFGLIGCGNVGRALLPLLRPFGGRILVHDPWIHDHVLQEMGVQPVSMSRLLSESRIIFLLAAVTTENQGAIGAAELSKIQRNAIVILVGRAGIVDFDALLDAANDGRIRAAIDVFPDEPVPKDHRCRTTSNTILSAHRSGGLPETFREVGRMVVDDLEMVLRGLPPQRMQRATLETTARLRSKPINANLKA